MKQKGYLKMLTCRKLLIVSTIGLLMTSVVLALLPKHKSASSQQNPFPSVSLNTVKAIKDVAMLSAIGTVKAAQGIQVSAATSGIITAINFQSGETVQAGQTLATLKNDDLKAVVLEDKAKYHLAELNAERSQKLVGKGYVSTQDVDQTISNEKQAKAQLERDEALLQNTIIKAPFTGQLGIVQVNLGQYVNAGQIIVSLQDRSKMYVDFSIPEKQSDLIHVGDRILATTHQGKQHVWQGKVIALGSQMDKDTRSLPIRAELISPYLNLMPGMYVEVSVLLPGTSVKPAIPQSTIVYNPFGDFVYIYQNGEVTQHYVTLGPKVGDLVLIEKGLNVGDQIITEGQQKLFNGAKVHVVGN